jgi:hypothetical protein
MRLMSTDLAHQFIVLDQQGLDGRDKADHLKWLRYYWDFCHQYYHYDAYRTESLPSFLEKLRKKRQSDPQRTQAKQAMTWFYRLPLILTVASSALIPSENLAAINQNPYAALRSVVLSSNATFENATTSSTCSPIPAPRDNKRPNHPDSYKQ